MMNAEWGKLTTKMIGGLSKKKKKNLFRKLILMKIVRKKIKIAICFQPKDKKISK